MAESFIGNIIEFLIGLIVLSRASTLIWIFAAPLLGLNVWITLISGILISIVLIVIFWFIRKMIAIGLIFGTVMDIIFMYLEFISV